MKVGCALALGLFASGALLACGGDDDSRPKPLVADPAVATGCLADPVAEGATRAKVIECADEVPDGVLAIGRVGDIVLENSRVEFVIRGFGEGYVFPGTSAGGLVDAARLGQEDLLREVVPYAEFNSIGTEEIVITEAGDDGPATVVIRGPAAPLPLLQAALNTPTVAAIVETSYVLSPDSDALEISTRLYALDGDDSPPTVQVGDILFFGGFAQSWLPGTGIPEGSAAGEFVATNGTTTSYGIVYPDRPQLEFLVIQNLAIALGPSRTVGTGEPITRFFIVGDGSISSVTDRAWELRGTELGTVSGTAPAGVTIEINDAAGNPITQAKVDSAGRYEMSLPVGSYTAIVASLSTAPGTPVSFTVAAGQQATADVAGGGSGLLIVDVTDGNAAAIPARVVIRRAGTQDRIEYVGASGQLSLPMPPGEYAIDVTRGLEYAAFTADPVFITEGVIETLTVQLDRVVDTDGWISLDTHIHSEMSIDSSVPLAVRLASIVAEGVEVVASTDHDFVTDYGPYVEMLGLGSLLVYRAGVETTTLRWGHVNAWPLVPDFDIGGGAAPKWYGMAPGEVFALLRDRGSDVVVQLNHPRLSAADLFNFADFNPATGLATQDPAVLGFPGADFNDLNFDAVEVANDISDDEFEDVFADWLSLVNFGHPAAATGASDSHHKKRFIGKARTYVWVGSGADDPATIDASVVDAALRRREVVVSQGAFVTAAIEVPGTGSPSEVGALVDLSGQTSAMVHIRVQAAPYMPTGQIRIFAGQQLVATIQLDDQDTAVVRYDQAVPVSITGADGFIVVVVDPAGPALPLFDDPAPSFTNPLLFDGDGDGVWTPASRP